MVPELRGRGIGRALLEATMEEARGAGASMIDLAASIRSRHRYAQSSIVEPIVSVRSRGRRK